MFSKIKDFLFGSAPVQAPVVAPYKVDAVPAGTEATIIAVAPTASVVEEVVIKPEVVAPNLVPDIISTELAPEVEAVAKPKKPPAAKKPRAPKAK
jgi:hypothetical protein